MIYANASASRVCPRCDGQKKLAPRTRILSDGTRWTVEEDACWLCEGKGRAESWRSLGWSQMTGQDAAPDSSKPEKGDPECPQ